LNVPYHKRESVTLICTQAVAAWSEVARDSGNLSLSRNWCWNNGAFCSGDSFMNMTIFLALMIASAAVYVLKTAVERLLVREAARTKLSDVRQQVAQTTR